MGDFRIQWVTKLIPSSTASVNALSGTDFDAIIDVSKALLIPGCCPMTTASCARESGGMNNSLLSTTASASIIDANTITFTDGDATIARTNRCGIWLLEYLGRAGGPNEIAMRGAFDITIASGSLTADSTAIAGISSLAKCIPFATARGTNNGSVFGAHFPIIDILNTGTDNVVRATRKSTLGDMTIRGYVAEFGSAWGVQKIARTFVAEDANETAALTAVNLSNTFTFTTMRHTQSNRSDGQYFVVWLDSTTTLGHRLGFIEAADKQNTITWVITHPDLIVARYSNGAFSTPAGTDDIASDGLNALQTVDVAVSAVKGFSTDQAMVIAYLGSNSTITTACPASLWMSWLTSETNVRHQRSTNSGGTESVTQVLDFSNITSLPPQIAAARRPGVNPLIRM